MAKTLLITGGTGFIGQLLCQKLASRGYTLTVLSRQSSEDVRALCGRVTPVKSLAELRDGEGFDGVINLAGEGIAEKRWTEARKQALRDSRIALTEELVEVLASLQRKPEVLVSGSAVGFYGDQGDTPVSEKTPPRDEFTHRLCRDWETAALNAEKQDIRVCLSRTGLVVGRQGGFLQRMLLPFKLGLGGRLGKGNQYMPWVHREDVVNGLIWMLETESASGPYNMVSPNPVTNQEFTRTLGAVLHRPTPFPAPAMALKLALGEMAKLLLTGQRAQPERLQAEGFEFRFAELKPALEDAVG
ncbi:MAG: TIGR01777 family oxidoreductase [Marinobacter sp.]|uniref:TIGR01777 family oxidoreductase n=1 Tax=Marinobacter sp. TaxID=50741 RepID=UPI00299D6C04|nr:TIGR01777 family oxidoreductase [Marinobacter sp.]MDX1635912.1 TIGR01777 family oxidoreductase [Marinobacter sp.]